jgi:putative transposase
MQKSQFTDAQIVAILQQAERGDTPIAEVCRQHNIAENTFYRWRSRFGGASASEAARLRELEKENARLRELEKENARLRELEKENARLKRLLAERDLEVDIIKELLQKK